MISENSDADSTGPEPDAHGQAALLLVESMLHVLVEKSAISLQEAISAVRTAGEVKVEVAAINGESSRRMQESLALLSAIAASLASDNGEFGTLSAIPD